MEGVISASIFSPSAGQDSGNLFEIPVTIGNLLSWQTEASYTPKSVSDFISQIEAGSAFISVRISRTGLRSDDGSTREILRGSLNTATCLESQLIYTGAESSIIDKSTQSNPRAVATVLVRDSDFAVSVEVFACRCSLPFAGSKN
jgi:hypothetical protein